MLVPLADLVELAVGHSKDWAVWCWLLAALVGACAAAYALRNFTRDTLRDQLLCLATVGVIGIVIVIVIAITSGQPIISGYSSASASEPDPSSNTFQGSS